MSETASDLGSMATDFDVVVVGGGIAGLTAALAAIRCGAEVALVEKGQALGGSWGSSIHTITFHGSDGRQSFDSRASSQKAIDWLRQSGCAVRSRRDGESEIATPEEGPETLVPWLVGAIRAAGGKIYTSRRATRVVTSGTSVTGLMVAGRGKVEEVACGAVILCTGGFGSNPEMLTRYLGPWGDRIIARCGPGSTGDGIQMGLEVGAAASHGLSSIHGHPVVSASRDPRSNVPSPLLAQPVDGILINRCGVRFTDEAQPSVEINQELAFQPEGRGYLIVEDGSRLADVAGATRCATLDQVRETLHVLGAHGGGAVETILDAMASTEEMRLGRSPGPGRLDGPPFAVLPVAASVTWTRGGLLTTPEGGVLDRQSSPIAGLLAAGTDAGDSSEEAVGGAAWALGSGLEAGANASRSATATRHRGSSGKRHTPAV